MSEFAIDTDGKNKYNRNPNQRPVIKVGNWVEDQAIFDELQRQRRTGEVESAGNSIKDYRVDNRELYSTANRDIGHFGAQNVLITYSEEEKQSLKKVPHYDPFLESQRCDVALRNYRKSHDILNATLPTNDPEVNVLASSLRSSVTGVLAPVEPEQLGRQQVQQFKVKF